MNSPEMIEHLSRDASSVYPEVGSPLAIVASFEPKVVDSAIDHVLEENLEHKRAFLKAQRAYDAELEGSLVVSEGLRLAAIDFSEAEATMDAAKNRTELARSVSRVQERLAFPMRAAATVLSALAIGVGSGAYAMESQPDRYGDITVKEAKSMKETYSRSPLSVAVIMGIVGGFAGGGASGALVSREARRRARKIIANGKSAEYLSD